MKKKITITAVLLLFIFRASFAQPVDFDIKIVQDSVRHPNAAHELWLEKKAFQIQVLLKSIDGVYLYAAFKDSIYKIADDEKVPGFSDIPAMCMAEDSFNPNQELIISDDGWAYWFYDPKENWHRFDKKLIVSGKEVKAFKSVKQFYFPPQEKSVSIENINEPLYLFFFSAKSDSQSNLIEESARYKIKINWR